MNDKDLQTNVSRHGPELVTAPKMGVEINLDVPEPSPAYAAYAGPIRPGISVHILLSAEIKYSDYPEPGSIEIPYWTSNGELTRFKRWRLPMVRANGQKYYQEPNSAVYAYFPPGFYRRQSDNLFGLGTNSIVLVEGEFKALSLLELGLYTIGLPSFNIYLRDENGYRRLLRDLQVTFSRQKIRRIFLSVMRTRRLTLSSLGRLRSWPVPSSQPRFSCPESRSISQKVLTIAKRRLARALTTFFAS